MILSLFVNGQRCAEPAQLNLYGLTGAEAPDIEMILQRVHAIFKHDGLQFTSRDDGVLVESVQRGLKSRGYRPGPLVMDPACGVNSEHSIAVLQSWMRDTADRMGTTAAG